MKYHSYWTDLSKTLRFFFSLKLLVELAVTDYWEKSGIYLERKSDFVVSFWQVEFIFRVSALQVHAIYSICFLSRNTQCTQCTLLPLIRCLAQRIVKLPAVPRANYRPICHSSITIQLLLILLQTLLPVYCVLWEQEADQGSDLWCTDGGIPNTYLNSSSWAAHALCGLFFFSLLFILCSAFGEGDTQVRPERINDRPVLYLYKTWSLYSQPVLWWVFYMLVLLFSILRRQTRQLGLMKPDVLCRLALFSAWFFFCRLAKYTVSQRGLRECDLRGTNSIWSCFRSTFGESGCRPEWS